MPFGFSRDLPPCCAAQEKQLGEFVEPLGLVFWVWLHDRGHGSQNMNPRRLGLWSDLPVEVVDPGFCSRARLRKRDPPGSAVPRFTNGSTLDRPGGDSSYTGNAGVHPLSSPGPGSTSRFGDAALVHVPRCCRPRDLFHRLFHRSCGSFGSRSQNMLISRHFLVSGRQDLNLRPPGPQPGALPDCATPRGLLESTDYPAAARFEPSAIVWNVCSCMPDALTRTCGRCGQDKPISDYAWRRKACGQRDNYCRPCRADYKREHYAAHRERYIADAVRRDRNWDSVLYEIAKCDVVCANCHRRRTAHRGGFARAVVAQW